MHLHISMPEFLMLKNFSAISVLFVAFDLMESVINYFDRPCSYRLCFVITKVEPCRSK